MSRTIAYRDRAGCERFRLAWEDAVEESIDNLKLIAWQRAIAGEKVVETRVTSDAAGRVVKTVRIERQVTSDRLLLWLLEHHCPEWRLDAKPGPAAPGGYRAASRDHPQPSWVTGEHVRKRSPERARELARLMRELHTQVDGAGRPKQAALAPPEEAPAADQVDRHSQSAVADTAAVSGDPADSGRARQTGSRQDAPAETIPPKTAKLQGIHNPATFWNGPQNNQPLEQAEEAAPPGAPSP